MNLSADLSAALLRRETKERVAQLLAPLAPADRKAVLFDLLADDGTPARGQVGAVAQQPLVLSSPNRGGNVPVRGTKGDPGGKTGALLDLVRRKPSAPIYELAQELYEDPGQEGQNRVRSLLAALKKQNLVTNVGSGKWEATG
jgi:hypothetical protein